MSYNHHNTNMAYVPSYTSNTGEAFMARRGWDASTEENNISFYGKRSGKRVFIALFLLILLLLITAIVIIILFSTGVITSAEAQVAPTTPFAVTIRPIPFATRSYPPLFSNETYSCSFNILRQANAAYATKTSANYVAAFNLIRNALNNSLTVIIGFGGTITLDDLQNRGNDLVVLFRVQVPASANIQQGDVTNIIRSNIFKIEGQLGGNASIDQTSISVVKIMN